MQQPRSVRGTEPVFGSRTLHPVGNCIMSACSPFWGTRFTRIHHGQFRFSPAHRRAFHDCAARRAIGRR
jgi:hypothetical protein